MQVILMVRAAPYQLKRASASTWTSLNPVLAAGEPGVEKGDPPKLKIGDGVTAWADLGYVASGGGGGASALADLTDVDLTGLADGKTIVWDEDDSKWVVTDFPTPGAGALGDLTDVDLSTPPTEGQALLWDDGTSKWVAGTAAGAPGADGEDGAPGADGEDGVGITGITLHATVGLVKTYRIALSDGSHFDFDVSDGADGADGEDGAPGTPGAPGADGADGGLGSRTTANKTTSSIANNASETGTITMEKGFRLLKIQVDKACRVRVYATAAQMTSDAARPIGTDPVGDHGLLFEFVATASGTTTLNPLVDGANMETSPSSAISISITNRSGSTGTVSVTFTYQATET